MAEFKQRSGKSITSIVLDEDTRVLLYNAKKSGQVGSSSREYNAYIRAKYGNKTLAIKADLVARISDLKTQLVTLEAELEKIERQEKIDQEIRARVRIQEISAAWYLRNVILSLRDASRRFDPNNPGRFMPLYEAKLEKINFHRQLLIDDFRKGQTQVDLEDLKSSYKPSWKSREDQNQAEERMLTDPEFMRILEVQQ